MGEEMTVSSIEITFLYSNFLSNLDSQVSSMEIMSEEPVSSLTRGVLPSIPSTALMRLPSNWGEYNFGHIEFESSNWDSTDWVEIPNYQYFSTPMNLLSNLRFKRFREDIETQGM